MDYSQAGVNIDSANDVVAHIKKNVGVTHSGSVLTGIGSFGTLYSLKDILENYRNPILVQSVDGIGTKLKIATMVGQYKSLGFDIVNHCCNDILCQGAKPLTFLDYYGTSVLDTAVCKEVLDGIIEACYLSGVSLMGGELAELPGIYEKSEFDVVGAITGVVERDKVVTGKSICEGDMIIGLTSNGLHTNGYSLARKVLFEKAGLHVETQLLNGDSLGEALLRPHLNYTPEVLPLLESYPIKGMAHITGGGFIENIPRILPDNVDAQIDCSAFQIPEIFQRIQKEGEVDILEMYRTFNMGIGYIIVIAEEEVKTLLKDLHSPKFESFPVGKIVSGSGKTLLVNY